MNVQQLFDLYIDNYAVHRCRTADKMRSNFERYFGMLKDLEVEQVKPFLVQGWHNRLASDHGEVTANRSLTMLRTVYNFGEKWELIDCRNPARAIRKFKEISRERVVQPYEMPILLDAIEQHGTVWTKDIFLLCLYTAQRLANVCSMKWDHLDTIGATWTIPATDFKTGVPHEVPLVDEAMAILARRKAIAGPSEYIFPGRRDVRKHIDYPYNGWRKVLKAARIADLNPHDLRRTHATYQVDEGVVSSVTAKTLGHANLMTVHKYAKARNNKVRNAMSRAVKAMLSPEHPPEAS